MAAASAKVVCKSFLVRVPGKQKRKRVTFNVRICVAPVAARRRKRKGRR